MSNNITLKNPVALTAPSAMSAAKKSIDQNSQSLSTGVKANNDVVSTFLGNGLADQAKIGSKILDSMGYSKGILSTAMGSLNSSANNISDMISTVVASSGASEEVLASLNDSLNQKLESLKLQISSTEYNGRKILNGDLGSDSSVRSNFTNKAVSVKKMEANPKFLGESHAGTSTVKFGDNSKITSGDN
jgi:flagellin-like hook-associated protein FlgL